MPSGISSSLISIFARTWTFAAATFDTTDFVTIDFSPYTKWSRIIYSTHQNCNNWYHCKKKQFKHKKAQINYRTVLENSIPLIFIYVSSLPPSRAPSSIWFWSDFLCPPRSGNFIPICEYLLWERARKSNWIRVIN